MKKAGNLNFPLFSKFSADIEKIYWFTLSQIKYIFESDFSNKTTLGNEKFQFLYLKS